MSNGQNQERVTIQQIPTGVPGLDEILGGGLPEYSFNIVAGAPGCGKTTMVHQFVFANASPERPALYFTVLGEPQFIAEGLREGEPGVVTIFEEVPTEFTRRAAKFGLDFDTPQKDGKLKVIYIRPLDLSVDETVYEIIAGVKKIGAKRVVIDSMVGFEMALAPEFRHEFRESLYRMIGALTRLGVTVVSTVEVEESFTSMGLSNFAVSFLSDDILRLRYVSINGQLRKMLLVVKMRGSAHSIDMWEYKITEKGIIIGAPLRGYRGLTSGIPGPWSVVPGENDPEPRQDGPTKIPPESKVGPHE